MPCERLYLNTVHCLLHLVPLFYTAETLLFYRIGQHANEEEQQRESPQNIGKERPDIGLRFDLIDCLGGQELFALIQDIHFLRYDLMNSRNVGLTTMYRWMLYILNECLICEIMNHIIKVNKINY